MVEEAAKQLRNGDSRSRPRNPGEKAGTCRDLSPSVNAKKGRPSEEEKPAGAADLRYFVKEIQNDGNPISEE